MRTLVALALLLACAPGRAWNDFGHMCAAAVAYDHLSEPARRRALDLLRLNPDYGRWVRGIEPAEQGRIAFLRASAWADAIKHRRGYHDGPEANPGTAQEQVLGYADLREHRRWHYIDLPYSPDGTPALPTPAPNLETELVELRRGLASEDLPPAVRSYELVWLIHVVADAHQPLHTISRFTREFPAGDAGGNRVALCARPCRSDLHAFWDDVLGHSRSPWAALRLARTLPGASPALVARAEPSEWITESFDIARRAVYVEPIGPGPGPYALTPQYRARALHIARERIALAGERLAALLNRALDSGSSGSAGSAGAVSPPRE